MGNRHTLHEPARTIIERLGGPSAVSEALNIAKSLPYQWQYPKQARGTGGVIPQRYHRELLEYAEANNLPLAAADFVPPARSAA